MEKAIRIALNAHDKKLAKFSTKIQDLEDVVVETAVTVKRRHTPKGNKGDNGRDGRDGKNGRNGRDGNDGNDGNDGRNGFDGLQGNQGESGDDGLSAYELWLSRGNKGSEEDFLDSLSGQDGKLLIREVRTVNGGGVPLKAGDIGRLSETLTSDDDDEIAIVRSGSLQKIKKSNLVVGGAGDVNGPASSTNNAIARFDGTTGKIIQNSAVTIDDSGNIATAGTVDGRDVSTDGDKLDGIEALADVTDATNVAAAGGLIDTNNLSDLDNAGTSRTNLGVEIGSDVQAWAAVLDATTASFTTADETKLDGIEALADVTDATNVVAALSGATLTGSLNMGGQNLLDVHELRIDAVPDTDHTANGLTTNTINAGATIAIGELVYLGSGGKWLLTDADAAATATGMLGLSVEASTDTNPMIVGLAGSFVRDDTFAFTVGAELFVGTTPGAMVETAPSGTGDIVRVVGYAVSADVVYFNPGATWVEIA